MDYREVEIDRYDNGWHVKVEELGDWETRITKQRVFVEHSKMLDFVTRALNPEISNEEFLGPKLKKNE